MECLVVIRVQNWEGKRFVYIPVSGYMIDVQQGATMFSVSQVSEL